MNRRLFVSFCLSVFMLLAVWAGLTVTSVWAQEGGTAGAGETLTGFTANGYITVTLNYTGSVPFATSVYLSYNGTSQDVLLDTVTVTDPDGSQEFVLGTDIDLISSSNEVNRDYYLLAVSNSGSTALFEGVYQYASNMVFVHGRDTLTDSIQIARVSNDLVVTWNLANSYTYPLASVTAVRARSHGNHDEINATNLTSPATIPTYQMGGAGDDNLKGGSGNDLLVGGPGKDRLRGTDFSDTVSYFDSPAGVSGSIVNAGNIIDGWGATDTVFALQNLVGSEFNDTLNGNTADNFIYGLGGNDTINGSDGNDTVYGDNGIDTIAGGIGNDNLYGGGSRDNISGGVGNDIIQGGLANDKLLGDDGDDTLYANTDACTNDGSLDSLNGGTHTAGDSGFYTFAQDTAVTFEFTTDCP